MATALDNLTVAQLQRAAQIKQQMEVLEAELTSILGGAPAISRRRGRPPGGGKKGGISAAGRAKIAAAQRLRWAKFKASQKTAERAKTGRPQRKRRRLSPEGRARIAAAQKARWARARQKKG
jgi:hypothetical protein